MLLNKLWMGGILPLLLSGSAIATPTTVNHGLNQQTGVTLPTTDSQHTSARPDKANPTNPIDNQSTQAIMTTLASDDFQGRQDGTMGGQQAADYIERQFIAAGLAPYSDLNDYRQYYTITPASKPNTPNRAFKLAPIATSNVIGFIKGNSRPKQVVVFSAHYDHLGANGKGKDTIYNGANDDASGVTALIQLAKYYKQQNNNQRSLLFVAFSGEEKGGLGSRAFADLINPADVVAMLNIEMIGTQSKWGKNSAYITGFDRSDFGTILQHNVQGTSFSFHPDPYPSQHLFYRSDNASLAVKGVPAHTISTSKMDMEPYYHTVNDEVSTLDLSNLTRIIDAIIKGASSIVDAKSTPTRIAPATS